MQPDPRYLRVLKRGLYRALHAWRRPHFVESRCAGVEIRHMSNSRMAEAIYANAFEREERLVLDRLIRPGMLAVDVGANLGFYTCVLAERVLPAGRVIAFEPTPKTFVLLEENVHRNRFSAAVECHCAALADREGTVPLHVYPEGSDVYNSVGAPVLTETGHETLLRVPTTTLDRCLEGVDLQNGGFLKIDVEGFEHQVLRGGLGLLRRDVDLTLMVELYEPAARQCGSSTLQTISLLESCGYSCHWIMGQGALSRVDAQARHMLLDGVLPPNVFFFNASSWKRVIAAGLENGSHPGRRVAA